MPGPTALPAGMEEHTIAKLNLGADEEALTGFRRGLGAGGNRPAEPRRALSEAHAGL